MAYSTTFCMLTYSSTQKRFGDDGCFFGKLSRSNLASDD